MEELKVCHLCKENAVHTAEDEYQTCPSIGKWRIHCDACGMRTGTFRTEEDVIEWWNTRHEPEVLVKGRLTGYGVSIIEKRNYSKRVSVWLEKKEGTPVSIIRGVDYEL